MTTAITHRSTTKTHPITTLGTLTRVETNLLLREPAAAVLFTLALPLVLLALNGSDGNEPNPTFGGAGTVDVLLTGPAGVRDGHVGDHGARRNTGGLPR